MDILFVNSSPVLGGAERILVDVAGGLDRAPAVACPEGPLARHAREAGLTVLALRERSPALRASPRDRLLAPVRVAAQALEVRRLVARHGPRCVVGWGMRAALAASGALAAARPRPAFVFQHNDLLPGPAIARGVRAAAARADRVVALSETIAADLDPRGRLGARLAVAHPGVDLDRLRPAPPVSRPHALLLGAVVAWKRPDLALEAVALAARRLPELRLTVAGAPLDRGGEELLERLRLRAEAPDLAGRVEFAGPVDAAAALGETACLLHCAEREPFGMVVLEALARARPVVAPAAGGPAEILDPGCGLLYPPGDATAAAAALAELLGDPVRAAELGRAGRARAEQRFGLEEARRRYAELLGAGA